MASTGEDISDLTAWAFWASVLCLAVRLSVRARGGWGAAVEVAAVCAAWRCVGLLNVT